MRKLNLYKMSTKIFFIFLTSQILSSCLTQQPAPIEFKNNPKLNDSTEYYVPEKDDTITTSPITEIPNQTPTTGYLIEDPVEENLNPSQSPLTEELLLPELSTNPSNSAKSISKEQPNTTNNELDKELDSILTSNKAAAKQNTAPNIEPNTPLEKAPALKEETKELPNQIKSQALKHTQQIPTGISSKFINPVNGNVIKNFNPEHQGISIAANLGDPVKAIYDGQVVYSGYDTKFGNLIIIKLKEGEFFAAFAHLDDLLITKGQQVTQGQIIGHIGQSGNIKDPQLYLAIKKGKTALDPMPYLNY